METLSVKTAETCSKQLRQAVHRFPLRWTPNVILLDERTRQLQINCFILTATYRDLVGGKATRDKAAEVSYSVSSLAKALNTWRFAM